MEAHDGKLMGRIVTCLARSVERRNFSDFCSRLAKRRMLDKMRATRTHVALVWESKKRDVSIGDLRTCVQARRRGADLPQCAHAGRDPAPALGERIDRLRRQRRLDG